ncbi:MAG TPA: GNAT family N-acetyltransferase [Actinophytocola sp.]|nr:GNAT family N-acetyltransferase [Actinophytocola sp.]
MAQEISVRGATLDDVPDLVELRGLLFAHMADGWGPPTAGAGWQEACAAAFAGQLSTDRMRVLVIDGDGEVAACGLGVVDQRLPSPYNASGLVGHVFGIVTRPGYRKRGYARAVVTGLLAWFDARGLTRVDLNASADGQSLYRSLGFAMHPDPEMRRSR